MTDDIEHLADITKGRLFYHKGAGFLGRILGQCRWHWTKELNGTFLDTAAIMPTDIYWNPDFFLSCDDETRITVLAHELWHNALLHGVRIGDRCPDTWNIAADHVINLMLQEHGYYMNGFDYCMDPQFKGWTTEDIYDHLIQSATPIPMPALGRDVLPTKPGDVHQAVKSVVAAQTGAQLSGITAGEIPGELQTVLEEYLHPQLPWNVIFYNYFNERTHEAYSYAKPNRRYSDPLLPGKAGMEGLEHLMFMMDASGSVSDHQIKVFNTEVKHVKETLFPQLMSVYVFDTKIRKKVVIEEEEDFPVIEFKARGGTSLVDVFHEIKKQAPSAAVIFSDMHVTIPEDPGIPIIWVAIQNPGFNPSYGKVIHISE